MSSACGLMTGAIKEIFSRIIVQSELYLSNAQMKESYL